MRLYNSISHKVEDFQPIEKNKVRMYCCGPTVYDYTHLGHLRKYAMDDVLKRVLRYLGYEVKHVMNITDVGHLVSDGDEGEDKLEKGAKKSGKTVWEVAAFYTDFFEHSMKMLGVEKPDVTCKATDHIDEMIAMVQLLVSKGYAYVTDEAVYFDISKDPEYGALSGQKIEDKKTAVRTEVHTDPAKRNPADFALWFKRVLRFANHTMYWSSPWGDGFPGWHIECSAMSMKYLGQQLDIHTGGIDHIPIHHPNEIAQSECATGKKPFVKYWIHHNFLTIEGEKMSKSLGNFFTIDDITSKKISPQALRLLFLQVHYRAEMNFTWDALKGADTAFSRLVNKIHKLENSTNVVTISDEAKSFDTLFAEAISDDLNIAKSIGIMWNMFDSSLDGSEKLSLFKRWNQVLGLEIPESSTKVEIPQNVLDLIEQRKIAKAEKNYQLSDKIRDEIFSLGYTINDSGDGMSSVSKK